MKPPGGGEEWGGGLADWVLEGAGGGQAGGNVESREGGGES